MPSCMPHKSRAPGRRRGRRRSLERSRLAALEDAKFSKRKHRLLRFALSVSVPGTYVGRSRTPRNNSASGCVIQPWSSSSFSLGCLDCLLEPFPLVRLPWSLQRPFQASATSRSPSLAFFPLPFHRPLFGPLG